MVTSEFREYVKRRDIENVRKKLLAILNANPDMGDGQFNENLKYAADNLGDKEVFVPYSGEFEMKGSKEEWTTSYFAKIYLELRKEFSKELIMHLTKVAPVVYGEKDIQSDLFQQTAQKTRKLPKIVEEEQSNLREVCITIVKWTLAVVVLAGLIAVGINMF